MRRKEQLKLGSCCSPARCVPAGSRRPCPWPSAPWTVARRNRSTALRTAHPRLLTCKPMWSTKIRVKTHLAQTHTPLTPCSPPRQETSGHSHLPHCWNRARVTRISARIRRTPSNSLHRKSQKLVIFIMTSIFQQEPKEQWNMLTFGATCQNKCLHWQSIFCIGNWVIMLIKCKCKKVSYNSLATK